LGHGFANPPAVSRAVKYTHKLPIIYCTPELLAFAENEGEQCGGRVAAQYDQATKRDKHTNGRTEKPEA